MAVRVIWSLHARKDLREAGAYIRKDNPAAAKSFLFSVSEKVDLLVNFPEMGRVVAERDDPRIGEINFRSYRIIYRLSLRKNVLEIARIWHASRGEPEF